MAPQSRFGRLCAAVVTLGLLAALSCGRDEPQPPAIPFSGTSTTTPRTVSTTPDPAPDPGSADFSAIAPLINDAIAEHQLPGAVVQVGHAGKIVFRAAFGDRKLDGEPGLRGTPSPAEPMTEDTIFDLASLTKAMATAPAVLQLYEQGRVGLDDPIQNYLPEFNTSNDPRRARVTIRMLLTHTSGIAGDLALDGPWGLGRPDKPEGIHRALNAWVVFEPGETFHYSDIGFIILGALIEKLTSEPVEDYVEKNVFAPLQMLDTYYRPDPRLLPRIAPTAHDGDTPGLNPNFGNLLRGNVHDPTARRMGGASGSAGVFSTAQDVGRFAQALLDRRAGRPSKFPSSARPSS